MPDAAKTPDQSAGEIILRVLESLRSVPAGERVLTLVGRHNKIVSIKVGRTDVFQVTDNPDDDRLIK